MLLFRRRRKTALPDVSRSIPYGKALASSRERGNAEAQFNLGVMYENGLGDSRYPVEGHRPEAVRWLLAAAAKGLPRAQVKLAETYADESDTS